jgi:thiosulfate/3-mercaptopyruvate sulfurtransferase
MTIRTPLVSAAELQQKLADPQWKIFDVRHDLFDLEAGLRAYRAGHIPGAQFASIDDDLSGHKTGSNGRHPLPSREALVERFRAWGLDNSTQIVAYDAQGGQFAARLWWLSLWLGHRAVAVLDGGWPAWLAHGGAIESVAPVSARSDFTAAESLVSVVDTRAVLAASSTKERLLVDARMPERYRGEQEPIDPVAGHIPGAVNRAWQQNLAADQRFKTSTELRAEFETLLGGRAPDHVTHQCGSGVTACHNVLAMAVAGLPGSALYSGSWSEWIADPSRTIRTGAEP